MNLSHLGAISTGTVVIIGLILIAPSFIRENSDANRGNMLLLTFDIEDERDPLSNSEWCRDLSVLLEKYQLKAAVFLSGSQAEKSPPCVDSFSTDVDIGSRTFSHIDITKTEYLTALHEVRSGKETIDNVGKLDSRLFKAPYLSTDENIYSLLNRSAIVADFSYPSQYNVYENGQFIKHEIRTLSFNSLEQEESLNLISQDSSIPLVITFTSSNGIDQIESFFRQIDRSDQKLRVVNASELTGISLTVREDGIP